jgi:hypothetical protein
MNQPNNRNVQIIDVSKPATLYRVAHPNENGGLWYDKNGVLTSTVKAINLANKDLPMDPHPVFKDQGVPWISTTDNYNDLKLWFPPADMIRLAQLGYFIREIQVTGYRKLTFDLYGHTVYTPTQLVSVRNIGNNYAAN